MSSTPRQRTYDHRLILLIQETVKAQIGNLYPWAWYLASCAAQRRAASTGWLKGLAAALRAGQIEEGHAGPRGNRFADCILTLSQTSRLQGRSVPGFVDRSIRAARKQPPPGLLLP